MISKYLLQKKLQTITSVFFYMLLFISSSIAVHAQNTSKANMLIINSYKKGFIWTDNIVKGVESVLGKESVSLRVEYMDSKTVKYDSVYKKKLYDLYMHKYKDKNFDLIITTDDNALNFVREYYEKIFQGVPVVFAGVNNTKIPNIVNRKIYTGILEISAEKETIDLILKLHPKIKRLALIVDTTPSGKYRWRQLEKEFFQYPEIEFIRFDDSYKISVIEDKVRNFTDDTIVIFATLYRDRSGRFISLEEGISRISKASKQPIYTFHLQSLKYGTIGGKLLGGKYHGELAAKIALEIIKGKKRPQDIPIFKQTSAKYIFDYFQLKRFNIQVSKLPKESIIINRPISFYAENKTLIWSLILFIFLLFMIILIIQVNIIKRRRIEQRLKALISNLPGMAYRTKNNKEWSMLFLSDNCKKLTGYEADDFIQNKLITYNQIIHVDDKEHVWDTIQNALMIRQSFEVEYRIVMADGLEKWVWESGVGVLKNDKLMYIEGIILDNDKRKKAEKGLEIANDRLEQKKKELETIIQEAPNPMIISSEDGNISMINQAWSDYSGYLLDDIPTVDTLINFMFDKDRRAAIKEHINSLYKLTEHNNASEFTILTKSRDKAIWQFSSAPLGVIDGKRTVISSAVDITELKKKDEMLINQSRLAAMGEMIGMIAHQWRQPISSIAMDANNMLLDIALEDFNTTQAEKYANSITEQTQHLSHTIDDFRNFFKPDKVISEVNIREILDSTLSIVKDSLKNNNIKLTTSFETDKEVKAYPRELMQVFVNIINNSKDALRLNKPVNAIISIRVYEDEKYINTQVCDNGGGIDVDILPKVFDPYFSTKDEKTGTGIGLYMSKMIIENHLAGTIEVYNNDDGACFRVRLLKEQMGKG